MIELTKFSRYIEELRNSFLKMLELKWKTDQIHMDIAGNSFQLNDSLVLVNQSHFCVHFR